MNNMWKRSFTGLFFVTALIGSIYAGKYTFIGLFFIITVLGLLEFFRLAENGGYKPLKVAGTLGGALFYLSCSMFLHRLLPPKYVILIIPILFLILFVELFNKSEKPIGNIAITLLGVFYVALPFTLLSYFAYPPPPYEGYEMFKYNPNVLLGFFFLLWTSESFAYAVGIKLGKHRLFERISPKKSWEGTIGGAVFCCITAYILSLYFVELSPKKWFIIAGIIIVFGTLGDLVQSMFKRSMDVKDTGNILPGHGGILDRFDGAILSIPFVFAFLQLFR